MPISINNNTIIGTGTNGEISLSSGQKLISSGSQSVTTVGNIVGVTTFSNSTRTSLSATSSTTLWSAGNVTKKYSNSRLIITGQLVFGNGESYNMGYWWQIGASGLRRDGIFQHHYASDQETTQSTAIKLGWFINGEFDTSATGNLAVSIGWAAIDGGANLPGTVWNPNASDDSRSQQHSSNLTIFEVLK